MPDAVELWLEREPEKSPKYRLWTKTNRYWDPTCFTMEVGDSDKQAASDLVERFVSAGGLQPIAKGGDLITEDEMNSILAKARHQTVRGRIA